MGQKVHPYGFRLGIIRKSRSRWFAEGTEYRDQLLADMAIRKFITDNHRNAGLSDIIIERTASNVSVTIQTAKPGIIIGRGGRDVDVLRQAIEKKVGGRVRLNVEETPDPDINAQLIAENIAGQIERRVSHRRAMQQAIERAMRMGALGARAKVSGRLSGAEIARTESLGPVGRVPLHTLRADVEYGMASAATAYGNIGVKVWVYKGEILPPRKVERTRTGEYEAGPSAEDWERVAAAARHTHPGEAAEGVAEPVVEAAAVEVAPEVAEAPVAAAPVAEVEAAESAPEAPGEQEATQDVDA
jgi:small subunit ribosomal protein S3